MDHIGQRVPLDQLHGVIMQPPIAADRIDRNDVRVVQRRRGMRFVAKTLQPNFVQAAGKRQHLQRHATTERQLNRIVNHPHAPAPEFADDLKVADRLGRELRVGRDHPQRFCRRGAGPMHQRQSFQRGTQLRGDLGVFGQVNVDRRRFVGVQQPHVVFHRRNHAAVFGFIRCCHRQTSPIVVFSFASPRTHNFSTLSTLRPIALATSANGNPSTCRNTITCR